ncbi:hypothetical protein PHYSODRAFT_315374 [Phytophthora sojae]|uniref:Uncharacterized protein n=1 Tax=Phytophthora sojae (strain P6497) TaxID=1094619 RepID=G4ZJK3_PHYSP|nr:hypothetical protein PHYSODRAFT_315374 [Phytophthora sojae]EGZ18868.1 hypothetical protein PHYSODRAFT_315374 [Phytophthora sojae]|eukprot:XP_009527926.1 hypothetical protein PHYSODRAFT_315374 [Phytophthora sojae]
MPKNARNPTTDQSRGTVRKWPQELKDMRKLQLHCARMSRFRNKRAAEKKSMLEEHQQLEQLLEQRLVELRRRGLDTENLPPLQRELQRLVLEHGGLRDENVALRQELSRHLKYLQVIQRAAAHERHSRAIEPIEEPSAVTVRCINSQWQVITEQAGRRVDFPSGDPSFFFHPFSRQEFNAVLSRHDTNSSARESSLVCAGTFLGWNIYHGAAVQGNDWIIDHVRCSRRIERSIDTVLHGMCREDGTSKWPIMPTSKDQGLNMDISIQTLQTLDDASSVIVRYYSGGAANYRYMCLVKRSNFDLIDGQRVYKFYYVVADSEANARSRDADPAAQYWGGYSLTLIEADGGAVDAVFNSLGCFKSNQEALGHITMFGRIVTRWEQLTLSSNLLKFC